MIGIRVGDRALFEATPDGVMLVTPGGEVLDMNPAMGEMLGYDPTDLAARRLTRRDLVVEPRDLSDFDARRARTGRVREVVTYRRKDGSTFPADVSSSLFRDDDGHERALVIVRDATESLRRQRALRESEERFSHAFAANPGPIALIRRDDGTILDVNPAFTRTFGYADAEVAGRTVDDLGLSADPDLPRRVARALREETRPVEEEVTFRTKDGSIGFGVLSYERIELAGERAAVLLLHDVSERKHMELRAEQERHFTEALVHSLPGIFYVQEGDRLVRWNENLEEVTGYAPYELQRLSIAALIEESAAVERSLRAAAAGGTFAFEGHLLTRDGARIPHLFHGEGVTVDGGGYTVGVGIDSSERRRSQEALRRARERLQRAEDISLVMTLHADLEGRLVKVPPRLAHLLGYEEEELVGLSFRDITHPDDIGVERDPLGRLLHGEAAAVTIEKRYLRRDGEPVWVALNTSLVRDENDRPQHYLTYVRDVTEERRAQDELRTRVRQQEAVAQLAETMSPNDGLQELLDRTARIVAETLDEPYVKVLEVLPGGRELLLRSGVGWRGVTPGTTTFRTGSHSLAGVTLQTDGPIVFPDLAADARLARIELLHDHGVRSGVSVLIRGIDGPFGVIGAFSGRRHAFTSDDANFLKSISALLAGSIEQRRLLNALAHRAHHDELTGLPNRTLFESRLGDALRAAGRTGEQVAVLFLDLDRFKNINDSLGHHAGDQLLRQIPGRIAACLRREDVLARLAGDEFVAMLPRIEGEDDVVDVARRILQAFEEPFELAGRRVTVKATIGICRYPDDGLDVEELLRGADTAMYKGKIAGRNTFEFYVAGMNTVTAERLDLESDLRQALSRDEFELYYQPQVDLASGRSIGLEALLRWHRPGHGIVPPDEFIGIAEEGGLIVPIGTWVMRRAFRQHRIWRDRGVGVGRIAVNVAAAQFAQSGFPATVLELIREAGIPPEEVELEITEGVVLRDADLIARRLANLKEAGVRVALDDFGTGYSSLAYLRRLPIDRIKIDRVFVRELDDAEVDDGRAFVESMIGLARSLRLEVVAEGIETEAQHRALCELGGRTGQGRLFADPMPAEEIEARRAAAANLDPAAERPRRTG